MKRNFWVLFVFLLCVATAGSLRAQSLNFGAGDTPIEIFADNGIEWQPENL